MTSPVSHPQIQRTLAAIVVTDAVGFSKRMSEDEDRALAIINRDLQLIGELCDFFEGQILKTVGDGVLMYFVSAVQAAACALEVQKTFNSFVKTGKANEHFTHRVGVHLGDIFFNQQDMMGTGVNIAARLESEAKPGGICMSQVVYDVVKSRLELDASYIGELSLKNIEEAVAAYHVWPVGTRPEETEGESTEAVAPLTITPLNAVLKTLSEHGNSRRIKKLLYGTHQSSWENDPAVLEGVALRMLLESLIDRNPTIEECKHSLYRIVGTLNRKEEYSQVADVILESLTDFYATDVTSSGLEAPAYVEASAAVDDCSALENSRQVLYRDIAERLEVHSDIVRVKKVLYCLCYDRWENDNSSVLKIDTAQLVEILYQEITTIQGLQNRLRTILLRLNRKTKYAPIADTLFRECKILYPEGNSQISMPGAVDNIDETTSDNTQINLNHKATRRWLADKQTSLSSGKSSEDKPLVPSLRMRSAMFGN